MAKNHCETRKTITLKNRPIPQRIANTAPSIRDGQEVLPQWTEHPRSDVKLCAVQKNTDRWVSGQNHHGANVKTGNRPQVQILPYPPIGSVAKLAYALVSGTNGKPCGFDSRRAHQKCSWWNWQTRQVQTLVRKHAGSTPAGHTRRVRDGTGRRIGLTPRWRCLRAGSTPAGRTLLRQGCGGQAHVHSRWTFTTRVMV